MLMNALRFWGWLSCPLLFLAFVAPCTADEPPAVQVVQPLAREVTDREGFTGRTQPAQHVELRARVTGYLLKVSFEDGAEVKKGDALFEIDPRPYQAQLDEAQAQLALHEASLRLAKTVYERNLALNAKVPGAVTQQQLDQDKAAMEEAQARVAAAKATVELRKLNLSYTHVTAPITGRISRRFVDTGNLVKADDTILATMVSKAPMYVYFDLDERTYLKLQKAVREKKVKPMTELPVMVGLTNEEGFPRRGTVDFTDSAVNPSTGTIGVRAVLPNADGSLSPGLFCRVRLAIGAPYNALVVPERSIWDDQGMKFVFVVGDKDRVEIRRVELGQLEEDGVRVVRNGLKPGERVVLNGALKLRPQQTVKPEEVKFPEEKRQP
jgi:multidrug efflux system membrane fusion protein